MYSSFLAHGSQACQSVTAMSLPSRLSPQACTTMHGVRVTESIPLFPHVCLALHSQCCPKCTADDQRWPATALPGAYVQHVPHLTPNAAQYTPVAQDREEVRKHMHALLGPSTALLMPTAPAPAPLLNMDQDKLNDYRRRLITLTCIAGIASLPQVCGLMLGHLVQYCTKWCVVTDTW